MTDEKKTTAPANAAYGAATTALREAHREEFDALLASKRAEMGLPPVSRRTPEQVAADKAKAAEEKAAAKEAARKEKALATAQALAAEFPDILTITPPSLDAPEPHLTDPGF
ncbi:MAG: hypothetical protein ACOYB3_01890 [Azonexus sp.]